jgi:microcystin-dependent protein
VLLLKTSKGLIYFDVLKPSRSVRKMEEGTLGEVRLFAGNFAPRNWEFCSGQLISIASNTALFSVLGTTYGGNGTTTFGLPDLRGRVPVGAGQGPGLTYRPLGERSGAENHTLTPEQLPAHSHTLTTAEGVGGVSDTGKAVAAGSTEGTVGKVSTSSVGGGQPHNNMPPYLALNYVICMYGYYPSRP